VPWASERNVSREEKTVPFALRVWAPTTTRWWAGSPLTVIGATLSTRDTGRLTCTVTPLDAAVVQELRHDSAAASSAVPTLPRTRRTAP